MIIFLPLPQMLECQSFAFHPYFSAINEPAVLDHSDWRDFNTASKGVVTPWETILKFCVILLTIISPTTIQRSIQTELLSLPGKMKTSEFLICATFSNMIPFSIEIRMQHLL